MSHKKKIAIIGSRGYPVVYSGFETLIKELVERINDKYEITVYCHKHLFIDKPSKFNNVNLVYISTSKRKNLAQLIHSFKSFIHSTFIKKHDLIFAVNSANGFFGLIPKIRGIPTVINVDGIEWKRPKWSLLGKTFFYFSSMASTLFYTRIVTDAKEMFKLYQEKFNTESNVIEYGANINKNTNSDLIKKFNLKANNYYIIVGRLIPDNNSKEIISGFIASNSNKKLVIVGDVPYKDSYASSIKSIKDSRLVFLGYIKSRQTLDSLVHNSFAYFHGHEFGGTNPTLVEALSNNAKILAIDTVFSREVLNNGEYGLFFKKNNDSIKTLIQEIENDNSKIASFEGNGVKRINEKYNWRRISQLYRQTFEELLIWKKF